MADNGDIGIFSEEERDEISARIEAASAREALVPPKLPAKGEAARRGLFPLAVNLGAALLLGAGMFCLVSFQQSDAAEIRESGALPGTERRLIQEIRREVNLELNEKEAAIDAMNRRIAEVDEELLRLDSLEALTDEQRTAMESLRLQQDDYRNSLGQLQADRARILADALEQEAEARRREASLHARLEERQGELENLSARSMAEIEAARTELAKLSGEQEKSALVEQQLGSYYSAVSAHIQAGRYREASQTLAALKEYLATPSFQSLKRIQARKESDTAAVNGLSMAVAEALAGNRPAQAAAEVLPGTDVSAEAEAALRRQLADQRSASAEQGAALAAREQNLAELQKSAADLQKSLADLQKAQAELQAKNADAQKTLAERDRQLENLRNQNTAYARTIDSQQKTIATLSAELDNR